MLSGNRCFLHDSLYVSNIPIEYVDSFAHLGHVITITSLMTGDILQRRNG